MEYAFQQYRKRLTSYAHRRIHNYADAEDIAQEALIRLWQAGEMEHEQAWLYRVTAGLCVDRLRRAKSLARYVAAEVAVEDVAMYVSAPDMITPVEMRIEAEDLLSILSPLQQMAIRLKAQGLRSEDIGRCLGIPAQRVRRLQMEVHQRMERRRRVG